MPAVTAIRSKKITKRKKRKKRPKFHRLRNPSRNRCWKNRLLSRWVEEVAAEASRRGKHRRKKQRRRRPKKLPRKLQRKKQRNQRRKPQGKKQRRRNLGRRARRKRADANATNLSRISKKPQHEAAAFLCCRNQHQHSIAVSVLAE